MNKKQWLITIDLDKTLLNTGITGQPNYEFNPKNKEVIQKIISLGHKVSIITGRPWRDTEMIYESLGLDTLVANYNGAHIHHPKNNTFIDLNFSMNMDILFDIFNEPLFKKMSNAIIIETLNKTYELENGKKIFLDRVDNSGSKNEKWNGKDRFPLDPQAAYIGLDYNESDPYELLQLLKRKYGDSMFFRLWDERSSGWIMMEISQKGSDKGKAMSFIASYYNIPLSNTISFGDGLNDREMLLSANHGIAMKNAKGTIKTYANDTTDYTNDDAGVGRYLEDFFKLK